MSLEGRFSIQRLVKKAKHVSLSIRHSPLQCFSNLKEELPKHRSSSAVVSSASSERTLVSNECLLLQFFTTLLNWKFLKIIPRIHFSEALRRSAEVKYILLFRSNRRFNKSEKAIKKYRKKKK